MWQSDRGSFCSFTKTTLPPRLRRAVDMGCALVPSAHDAAVHEKRSWLRQRSSLTPPRGAEAKTPSLPVWESACR